jgi:RNA polymerase sigma-70 factor (ECF subfamily)
MDSFKAASQPAVNEIELVRRAQRGDRNAFSELVCLHSRGVTRIVFRMCGDLQLAEDAAQETFLQAWQHLPSYRPGMPLRSWLYRIAVNAAIDMLRRNKRILPSSLEDMPLQDPAPGPETVATREERIVFIQKAVLSLPETSRAVLLLREYEEMSYQEISDTLDIPLGTVMSRLNYARRLLKKMLEPRLAVEMETEDVQAYA